MFCCRAEAWPRSAVGHIGSSSDIARGEMHARSLVQRYSWTRVRPTHANDEGVIRASYEAIWVTSTK
jgi:hypothetical protein